MKANELKIGNLLIANNLLYRKEGENKIACVVGIDLEKEYKELKSSITIYHIDDEFKDTYGQWIKHLEPIPLTEEWLLRMGFEYEQDEKAFCITNELGVKYGVCKFENNWRLILYSIDDWQVASHINFVHKLQNLYFALTDEELTMK